MRAWRDGRWYVGQLRELPAVISQGRTLGELRDNVRDADHLVIKSVRPSLSTRPADDAKAAQVECEILLDDL